MISTSKFEFPEDLAPLFKKAKRMEWITVAYLASVTIVMYLAMGNSQAMKVAWIEDALSLIPSLAFLVAARYFNKDPDKEFPYGFHRAYTIAFLCGSVALFVMGVFLVADSSLTLIKQERPSIGAASVGNHVFWFGYLMYGALLYSSVPSIILGRKKQPVSKKLHNKTLYTDADTQKADWMTALAAMVGITGIGYGWWWADAVAAIFISLNVLKDGYSNLKSSVQDLMDRRPNTVDRTAPDPLLKEVDAFLKQQDWIKKSAFRFRENGHVYFGEIFIVANSEKGITAKTQKLVNDLKRLHWKIYDVTIMPVEELPEN